MSKTLKQVFVCIRSWPSGHPRGSCGQNGCVALFWIFMQRMSRGKGTGGSRSRAAAASVPVIPV